MAEHDEESALGRWSRRKMEQKQAVPDTNAQEKPAEAEANGDLVERPQPDEALLQDLPPVEELTADSDYTMFLRDGVPEQLRTLALRKLWRSNPIFANLDGLNDYDEDFSISSGKIVATAYRVGKGMIRDVLDDGDEIKEETVGALTPAQEDDGTADDPEPVEGQCGADLGNTDSAEHEPVRR